MSEINSTINGLNDNKQKRLSGNLISQFKNLCIDITDENLENSDDDQ